MSSPATSLAPVRREQRASDGAHSRLRVIAFLGERAQCLLRGSTGHSSWRCGGLADRKRSEARAAARGVPSLSLRRYRVAFEFHPAVVSVLLEAGADPNTRTDKGWTPLHEIAALPSADPALAEIIRVLLAAGAELDARTDEGSSPLHLAARHSASSALVGTLLDAGADDKAQDHRGDTPWDYVQTNLALKGTDTWWRLNDVRF